MLDKDLLAICDMQGTLFELSGKLGYDSLCFIKGFMNSNVARDLDKSFNFMQWCGESYILARLKDENKDIFKQGKIYDYDVLFWIGYVYRYFHYYKNENSKNILKIAPIKNMRANYLNYHTMSAEMSIDRLIEDYNIRNN